MDLDKLEKLALRFRAAMENIPLSEFPSGTSLYNVPPLNFPHACCGDTSELLGEYINNNGFEGFNYINGINGGEKNEIASHAWLSDGNTIVDITADQFLDHGYSFPKVFVSVDSSWHDSFEISEEPREGSYYYWKGIDENHYEDMESAYNRVLSELEL